MTEFEKAIVGIIRNAIVGGGVELPSGFDWRAAYTLGRHHQILPMMYYGLKNSNAIVPKKVFEHLELENYKNLSVSANQLYELDAVCAAFDEHGIDYMILKGSTLKRLYPHSEMRVMSDADVLIKCEQYEKIYRIMKELSFEEGVESNHEYVWDKAGKLHLELHKRLIPSYNKDYYSYFGDGWKIAKPVTETRYDMSDEDRLIYLLTHFAKHYRDGGIGIRHITDFYVYFNAHPSIDNAYIEAELKKLKLLKFYKNVLKTLAVWFDGEDADEMADYMIGSIIKSGSYGSDESHAISEGVRKSKSSETAASMRFNKIRSLIFLPYSDMKVKYPILKKLPILLPVMWIVRIISALIFKKEKVELEKHRVESMSEKNISDFDRHLKYVGLDFDFKE